MFCAGILLMVLQMTGAAFQEINGEQMKTDMAGSQKNGWIRIDYKGWTNAYRFQTTSITMVVVADVGARVMEYGPPGRNILWQDPAFSGAAFREKGFFHPGGSQFDLMDENGKDVSSSEPSLWVGEYSVDIKSPTHLTAASPVGTNTGLQIVRDIDVDPLTGKAVIIQTVFNRSKKKTRVSIWDRTWTVGPCVLAVPVETDSKWPEGWGFLSSKEKIFQALPKSSNSAAAEQFEFVDGVLTIRPAGKSCQIIMKSKEGWFAYIRDNLLYVKRYSIETGVYPLVNCPVSVWLSEQEFKQNGLMAEMEPMSPLYDIEPGKSCRFQEEWRIYLLDSPLQRMEEFYKKFL